MDLLHFKASVLSVTRCIAPGVRICVWLSLRLLARRTAGLSRFRQALRLRDCYLNVKGVEEQCRQVVGKAARLLCCRTRLLSEVTDPQLLMRWGQHLIGHWGQ